MNPNAAVLDSDFRYIGRNGDLMRTRTELAISKMLAFLGEEYEYDHELELKDGRRVRVDFKTSRGLIEVVDGKDDVEKYMRIKESLPDERLMAIGHQKYSAQIGELEDIAYYGGASQTGSIFLEDGSFSFDYAHILPLVKKCSILHGHTSSVMVELVGQMENNLLIDFSEAKRIIREVVGMFDHKFFINSKYLTDEDGSRYTIAFDGPRGRFELHMPKDTTYLLEGEATVENLSLEIIRLLASRMPPNVEAVGVYIYEGYNKGSHIISSMSR